VGTIEGVGVGVGVGVGLRVGFTAFVLMLA
jgi:hypothetical protein